MILTRFLYFLLTLIQFKFGRKVSLLKQNGVLLNLLRLVIFVFTFDFIHSAFISNCSIRIAVVFVQFILFLTHVLLTGCQVIGRFKNIGL